MDDAGAYVRPNGFLPRRRGAARVDPPSLYGVGSIIGAGEPVLSSRENCRFQQAVEIDQVARIECDNTNRHVTGRVHSVKLASVTKYVQLRCVTLSCCAFCLPVLLGGSGF